MRAIAVFTVLLASLLAACGDGEIAVDTTGPPDRPDFVLSDLTDTYGCGHGFWIGDPEQTVALRLEYLGQTEPGPSVTLPDPDWRAYVVEGSNLYANWCDDVVEANEPTPVEERSYEITGGSLEIEGDVPERFEGGSVTLRATGLEVTLDDGSVVELGDVTITNDTYGFFAG